MEKDNQKAGEELIDEEDLLNFELDDLSLEDMEKKASEFEDDIIELVDLVDKGPGDEEGEKKKDAIQAEEDQPEDDQEEFGFATDEITSIGDLLDEESLDHSSSELDLSGLSLSDLNDVPEPEPEKQKTEGEISEAELEEMLEDAPTEMLDLELQEFGAPAKEAESDLEKQEEPAEALESDLVEAKESEEKEISDEDIKDLLQEAEVEDVTLDLSEAEGAEGIEITGGDFGDMLQEADIEDMTLDLEEAPAEKFEVEIDEEKVPTKAFNLKIDEEKAPTEAFNLDHKMELDLEEQKIDDIDEATEEELLTPLGEMPSQEPVDLANAEAVFEEPEVLPAEPTTEKTVGISEEVIEDIVSRVVQETVERVTRETMIEVAEKVITEAIDALKQSLETISD